MTKWTDASEVGCASRSFLEVCVCRCRNARAPWLCAVCCSSSPQEERSYKTFQSTGGRVFGIHNHFRRRLIPSGLGLVSDGTKCLRLPSDARVCRWRTQASFWPACSQRSLRWTSHYAQALARLQRLSRCLRLSLLAGYEDGATWISSAQFQPPPRQHIRHTDTDLLTTRPASHPAHSFEVDGKAQRFKE